MRRQRACDLVKRTWKTPGRRCQRPARQFHASSVTSPVREDDRPSFAQGLLSSLCAIPPSRLVEHLFSRYQLAAIGRVDTLLDLGLEPVLFGPAKQFLVAKQRQGVEHNLCRAAIAATLDQLPDKIRVGSAFADILVIVALGGVLDACSISQISGSCTIADQFSSILSAAMKASCGISTWPNWRIFFLPFFCFSRSLRFLVMSPP